MICPRCDRTWPHLSKSCVCGYTAPHVRLTPVDVADAIKLFVAELKRDRP